LTVGTIQPAIFPGQLATLIAVDTGGVAGSVTIQGIAIDGGNVCMGPVANGILFKSTSGTVRDTVIQNFGDASCFVLAILVENDDSWPVTMTLNNNVIQNIVKGDGIHALNGQSASTLNLLMQDNIERGDSVGKLMVNGNVFSTNGSGVTASGNIVNVFGSGFVISDASTINRNVISTNSDEFGISIGGTGASVRGNTINIGDNSATGISLGAGSNNFTSNKIVGASPGIGRGIVVGVPTNNIQSNTFIDLRLGIEFGCAGTALGSNNFIDTTLALSDVPQGTSVSGNFVGVSTIETVCQ
jgi:hypothetical protein